MQRRALDASALAGASGTTSVENAAGAILFDDQEPAARERAAGMDGRPAATPHSRRCKHGNMLSRAGVIIRAYIRNSADATGGGNPQFHGRGRINVRRAVSR